MARAKFFLALAAVICVAPSHALGGSGPFPNWSTATVAPKNVPQGANTLRVDGDRLRWNGQEISESDVRAFLAFIANEMDPQPLTVLTYSATAPRARIQWARMLIEEVIRCAPGKCLEVTASSA